MSKTAILGVSSEVSRAVFQQLAAGGEKLLLIGRSATLLEREQKDLKLRYDSECLVLPLDFPQDKIKPALKKLAAALEDCQRIIVFNGYLGDQSLSQEDSSEREKILWVNYVALTHVLECAAGIFEKRKQGQIVVFSSVAGDRGRQSNYTYGSAKAGLSAFLSGLRMRVAKRGVHVQTVKPGFMATSMTSELNLPPLLTAQAEEAARALLKAMKKKKDVVYIKWFWRYIMLIIKSIPEFVFKRLNL